MGEISNNMTPTSGQYVQSQSEKEIDIPSLDISGKTTPGNKIGQPKDGIEKSKVEGDFDTSSTTGTKPTLSPGNSMGMPPLGPKGTSNPWFQPSFLVAYTGLIMDLMKSTMNQGFTEAKSAIKMISLLNEISKTISSLILDSAKIKMGAEIAQGIGSLVTGCTELGGFAVKFAASKSYANKTYNEKKTEKTGKLAISDGEVKKAETNLKTINKDFDPPRTDFNGKKNPGGQFGSMDVANKGKKIPELTKAEQTRVTDYNAAIDKRDAAQANLGKAKTEEQVLKTKSEKLDQDFNKNKEPAGTDSAGNPTPEGKFYALNRDNNGYKVSGTKLDAMAEGSPQKKLALEYNAALGGRNEAKAQLGTAMKTVKYAETTRNTLQADFLPPGKNVVGGKFGDLAAIDGGKKILGKEYNAAIDKRDAAKAKFEEAKKTNAELKSDLGTYISQEMGHKTEYMHSYASSRGFDVITKFLTSGVQAGQSFTQAALTMVTGQIDAMKAQFEVYAQLTSKSMDKNDSEASKARDGLDRLIQHLDKISDALNRAFNIKG